MDDLNDEQRKALVRAFCCKDFQMIIGVPGSGKQVTMVRFLTIAKQLGQKVVLFVYKTEIELKAAQVVAENVHTASHDQVGRLHILLKL